MAKESVYVNWLCTKEERLTFQKDLLEISEDKTIKMSDFFRACVKEFHQNPQRVGIRLGLI